MHDLNACAKKSDDDLFMASMAKIQLGMQVEGLSELRTLVKALKKGNTV